MKSDLLQKNFNYENIFLVHIGKTGGGYFIDRMKHHGINVNSKQYELVTKEKERYFYNDKENKKITYDELLENRRLLNSNGNDRGLNCHGLSINFNNLNKNQKSLVEISMTSHKMRHIYIENDCYGSFKEFKNKENFKVTLVTNPFAHLVSIYEFNWGKMFSSCMPGKFGLSRKDVPFEAFIQRICNSKDSDAMKQGYMWASPLAQIFNETGKCTVDGIIRLESIDDGISKLLDVKNIKYEGYCKETRLSSKNKKRLHEDYRQYYNEKLIKMVSKRYENELAFLGYSFESATDDLSFFTPDERYEYNIFKNKWRKDVNK